MAAIDNAIDEDLRTLTRDEIEVLADKLYAVAVASISTIGPHDRDNLKTASRALRRLLAAYERMTGRQLSCLLIDGGR